MKKPYDVTVITKIGGLSFFVGSYLVREDSEAIEAAKADLLAQLPLQVTRDGLTPTLPSFTQLQMKNADEEEDWIYF